MRILHSVTIDAGVLAVPHVDCSKDEVFQYVDRLLCWGKLLNNESRMAVYMSERASEALHAENLYPLRIQLKELFNIHGIVEYDVNTVAKITDKLLSRTPSFESCYHVKDVLIKDLETDPDVINLLPHGGLQSNLARCITLIAILRKHCSQSLGGHSLILREAPKQVIQVRVHIDTITHTRSDIPVLPCPQFFEGDVSACDDFRGLITCLDESAILVGAIDDVEIKLAIRIALFKNEIAQGDTPDWDGMSVPGIGVKFRELCQHVCSEQRDSLPPKILRSIVETIKGDNLQAVHALRIGKGGNDPQKMRRTDKAQRRDIDKEFHLHYWECSDGTIELASVVYHNDFSIPE